MWTWLSACRGVAVSLFLCTAPSVEGAGIKQVTHEKWRMNHFPGGQKPGTQWDLPGENAGPSQFSYMSRDAHWGSTSSGWCSWSLPHGAACLPTDNSNFISPKRRRKGALDGCHTGGCPTPTEPVSWWEPGKDLTVEHYRRGGHRNRGATGTVTMGLVAQVYSLLLFYSFALPLLFPTFLVSFFSCDELYPPPPKKTLSHYIHTHSIYAHKHVISPMRLELCWRP